MKFTYLAVVALFGIVIDAQVTDDRKTDMEIQEEAIGECADSSECAEEEFCIFTVIIPEDGEDKTWEPSVCGAEADCDADADGKNLTPGDK